MTALNPCCQHCGHAAVDARDDHDQPCQQCRADTVKGTRHDPDGVHYICHMTSDRFRAEIRALQQQMHADAAADMALGYWLRTHLINQRWKILRRADVEAAAADHPAIKRRNQ